MESDWTYSIVSKSLSIKKRAQGGSGKVFEVHNLADTNEFAQTYHHGWPIDRWGGVSQVEDFRDLFCSKVSFNESIGSCWGVSDVTTMDHMFNHYASKFNQDLSSWNISNVTSIADEDDKDAHHHAGTNGYHDGYVGIVRVPEHQYMNAIINWV
eukprot:scaffold36239_cov78-Attheya_sp.AAC.3